MTATTPDIHETRHCLCLAARRRARRITRTFERKLRPHGLRATQFSILAALTIKGPTPVGELARILELERTSLTRSAATLERNGWLETAPSDDGRERPLKITRAGRRTIEAAYPAWREAQRQVERELADGREMP